MSTRKFNFSDKVLEHLNFKMLYIHHIKCEGKWDDQSHSHNFSQIFFFADGKGSLLLDGTTFPVKAGCLVIVNPHIPHMIQSDPKFHLEYFCFAIEDLAFVFNTEPINRGYGIYNLSKNRQNYLFLLDMVLSEAEKQAPGWELVCKDMAEILINDLVMNQNLGLRSRDDPGMSKECSIAKSFIDSHYMDPITLEQLSEVTHMSKYYLIHSFNKFLGESPMNYLQRKRIQTAEHLLSTSNYSVSTVATNVGFSSQSYFAQVFKRFTGFTPAQFRKKSQAKEVRP